jgi:hypothetical protein
LHRTSIGREALRLLARESPQRLFFAILSDGG